MFTFQNDGQHPPETNPEVEEHNCLQQALEASLHRTTPCSTSQNPSDSLVYDLDASTSYYHSDPHQQAWLNSGRSYADDSNTQGSRPGPGTIQLSPYGAKHSQVQISGDVLYRSNFHQSIRLVAQSSLPRPTTRHELSLTVETSTSSPSESASAIATTSPSRPRSLGSDSCPTHTSQESPASLPLPRKTNRKRPHIELAPDQPTTTLGKPRQRVYVACVQCRDRKVRCDGARPVCYNCGRRANTSDECAYDIAPKRRGPDRTPGTRQRMARDLRNEINSELVPARRRRRRAGGTQSKPERHILPDPIRTTPAATVLSIPTPPLPHLPHKVTSSLEEFLPVQNLDSRETLPRGIEPRCLAPFHYQQYPLISNRNKNFSWMTMSFVQDASTSAVPLTSTKPISPQEETDRESDNQCQIAAEPSLHFTRKTWWDSLLSLYFFPFSGSMLVLTPSQRDDAVRGITSDLRLIFRISNYWFSFFHIPSFFGTFCDPLKRDEMQPSLLLSLLAVSTFWQSSEIGRGKQGRERAMRFREKAQSALEASLNAGWIDETLAQAAWLLAMFEICAHPYHSTARSTSSMIMLDAIICSLSLTRVDAEDPRASTFTPRTVPAVNLESPQRRSVSHHRNQSSNSVSYHDDLSVSHVAYPDPKINPSRDCSCTIVTLGSRWSFASEHTPLWTSTPAWDSSWSEGEIKKESCRRLCWSAMILAAGHVSYSSVSKMQCPNLFVANPPNYALLFSGESITQPPDLGSTYASKDTIWALHDRAVLLWHSCMQMRHDSTATNSEKAHFGVNAWLEADALEEALNRHTCEIERAFIYQGREYLFNTRMAISYEFQRFIPLATADVCGLFHRKKAEEWLSHQAIVATRLMSGLHTVTGNARNILAQRPFFVFWFMGQISRALSLWDCDNTMTMALDVCKAFLAPTDYLTALWPCKEQRLRYKRLRERLNRECELAGLPPIPPANLALPSPLSPETII